MTIVVNSWNEWDPLKRVIVGRPEGSNIPFPEPAWAYDQPDGGYPMGTGGPMPQEMVDAANEQMDYFVKKLEEYGVVVERVDVQPFMYNKPVSTPDWTQLNAYGINNPRDLFLCHGHYLIECAPSQRSRYYEYLNLRPLFDKYFREDRNVVHVSAPKPRLTEDRYFDNYYHHVYNVWTDAEKKARSRRGEWQLTEKEPLWDAADVMRFGKDLIIQHSSVTNRAGIDWVKRLFSEFGVRVHYAMFETMPSSNKMGSHHPRHIDATLVPLRPGLVMYCPEEPPLTSEMVELFRKNDWELVPAAEPVEIHNDKLSLSIMPKGGSSWISMNTFSISPDTVCVQAGETAYCEQLDKLGFNVIPVPYDKVNPFGGGLHCTTLDIYREGKMEDYFPKQIPGY
jgi:glycine amidinotransferase